MEFLIFDIHIFAEANGKLSDTFSFWKLFSFQRTDLSQNLSETPLYCTCYEEVKSANCRWLKTFACDQVIVTK